MERVGIYMENNESDIFLTDKQYFWLLQKARDNLDKIEKAEGCDSTETGNKYTKTNIGLCNTDLTTLETALFPDQYPERKSLKYRKENHMCPLDSRSYKTTGCFYTCLFFKNNLKDIGKIKLLYDKLIDSIRMGGIQELKDGDDE